MLALVAGSARLQLQDPQMATGGSVFAVLQGMDGISVLRR
jgi:hypothetical protein